VNGRWGLRHRACVDGRRRQPRATPGNVWETNS